MHLSLINIVTITLYCGAALAQSFGLAGRLPKSKLLFLILGYAAVILHGAQLHHWIDVGSGQNLTFFNMLSMLVWLVSVLILLFALVRPVESLGVFIFPVAALSIILVTSFAGHYVINTAEDPKQLVHILLSILTMSVLVVAGLEAILLAVQEYKLRHKSVGGFLQKLPPLQTMETLLFQTIAFGFVLLSVVLATSFYFFHQILLQQLWQKTVLVILAWAIFGVLLAGRTVFGWRGRKAIYCTLVGVFLLILAYFGGEILMELIL